MFEISVILDFSAAHNLRNYQGKCEKLHGHNWQVEAVLGGEKLDKIGMLLDFKEAKNMLREIIEVFDHQYLNESAYFRKFNPTSENIAKFIFQNLTRKVKSKNYKILRVSVWETPLNRATYYE